MPHLSSVKTLTWSLVKEPRQVVYLPDWWRARRRPVQTFQQPWWPRPVLALVASRISPGADVFEYGSGGSTHWLTSLGAKVTSVEHDPQWYDTVAGWAANVILRQPTAEGAIRSASAPGFYDDYVATIRDYPKESFDLVVIDGRARVACGLAAMHYVKPGGMLLLDDSQRPRYQPLCDALQGWVRTDVRGLKPLDIIISQTTIWTRPLQTG
jgi:hypothetical protein